jgi:putative acetyltransferase
MPFVNTADNVIVRSENPDEHGQIRLVNEAAFGRPDEADLVDSLRDEGVVLASLIAELETRVVGHILFSRMSIETASGRVPAVALAPMAVLPEYQRQGIGGRLIRYGLDLLRQRGERIVIVLGHPGYYPRFGFGPAVDLGVTPPDPTWGPRYFMARRMSAWRPEIRGEFAYPAPFRDL